MNDKSNQKSKTQKQVLNKNILESLNTIGSQVVETAKNETKAISDEFINQLLGRKQAVKRSGELTVGQTVEMNSLISGEAEKQKRLSEQLFFERRLINEEKQETSKKLGELRLRLQAIQTEAVKLVNSTQSLTEEVKTAVFTGNTQPSEYHIGFFENIIQMIVSFRKKIDSAITWLQGTNKRAEKKNYWAQYKKKGASFLLSPDHYLQRSAG